MKCPFCGSEETQVIDTRANLEANTTRRRRKCTACEKRFTTYERVDLKMPRLVKKDGSRTDFDRDKLMGSMMLALRKRPVATDEVEGAVDRVIERLRSLGERQGGPHAEVRALENVNAEGATVYVNLEPCGHHGRTPPCVDLLLAAKVRRVVAAMRDPNREAAGGGERLAAAGIRFEHGLLEEEARELNLGFLSRVTRGRPWVRLKVAATLDGRTALSDGRSQWI